MHSIEWWKNHFEKTELFEVELADVLPENEFLLSDYINEFQNVGKKIIKWNGKNNSNQLVSSGVYYYKLISKNFSITKKMLVLR